MEPCIKMKKIYRLRSDVTNFCSFIEIYPEGQESIIGRSMDQLWQPFEQINTSITLKLRKNEEGKKNYQFDISGSLSPFFVISEKALDILEDIILPRGQIFPVASDSKKKKFFGYYPTNSLSNCFNYELSDYTKYPNGLMIYKPVLISKNISDEYLFSIEEGINWVFVTDKFKQRVEEAGLLAFDFSLEIPTS